MPITFFRGTEKTPLLSGERKSEGELAVVRVVIRGSGEWQLQGVSQDVLVFMMSFLSIEERDALSRTCKKFLQIRDKDLLNMRALYGMTLDIKNNRFSVLSKSDIICRTSVQFLVLFLSALAIWGTVEMGIYIHDIWPPAQEITPPTRPGDPTWINARGSGERILYVVGMIALSVASGCILFGGSMIQGCINPDRTVRPSEAIGNLRRMVGKYNEIFPETPLGVEGNDYLMGRKDYLDKFFTARGLLKKQINQGKFSIATNPVIEELPSSAQDVSLAMS